MVLTRYQVNRGYYYVNDNKNHKWECIVMGYFKENNRYVLRWVHRCRNTKNSKAATEDWIFEIDESNTKFEQFEKAIELFKKIKRGEYVDEMKGVKRRFE